MIPGFPARPELVPMPAPEIADVATPQLSSFKITKVLGTVHRISITTATPTQPARFSQCYLFPSSRNLNVISVDIILFIVTAVGMSTPFQKRLPKKIPKAKAGIETNVFCTTLYNYVLWTSSASTQQRRQMFLIPKGSTNK